MILENPQELILQSTQLSNELKTIATKVFNGQRISFDEGMVIKQKSPAFQQDFFLKRL